MCVIRQYAESAFWRLKIT